MNYKNMWYKLKEIMMIDAKQNCHELKELEIVEEYVKQMNEIEIEENKIEVENNSLFNNLGLQRFHENKE